MVKPRLSTLSLFEAHRASLIDYAAPIVGCRAWAEDIVQDAYLRVSTAWDGEGDGPGAERGVAHPVGYLYRTVRNLAINWKQRRMAEQPSAPEILDRLETGTPTPEQEVSSRQELRRVAEALAELPERTRHAFELHRLGGLTLHQVAARLNISVGLTHKLVHEALTHCADRLDGDVQGEACPTPSSSPRHLGGRR